MYERSGSIRQSESLFDRQSLVKENTSDHQSGQSEMFDLPNGSVY